MIRSLFLIIILLVVLVITLIWTVPLELVLRQSGVANPNIGWAQVEGTVRKGRINGLFTSGQAIGDVSLELRPMSLLSLSPVYDVQWGGAGGRGTGVAKISGSTLELSELRLEQQVSAIEGLATPIRAIGGTLRLIDGEAKLSQLGCEHASGEMTTDVLSRAADQYGRDFGALSGPVSCEDGAFVLSMSGQSSNSDRMQMDARASFLGQAEFSTEVSTADTELTLVLSQIGFEFRDGAWRYNYSTGVMP